MAINLTTRRKQRAAAQSWPAVANVARNRFDDLRRLCDRPGSYSKRDEFGDVGRALKYTARLLWGERVTEPLRRGQVCHDRQILVLAVALDRLLHPDKSKMPRSGSEQYTDSARRRVARWFWAATFAGYGPRDDAAVKREAEDLVAWARGQGSAPNVVADVRTPAEEQIAAIPFDPGSWRHRAVVAVLARRNPRDLLTGERLEVERHFDAAIHGHHLCPRKWARAQGDDRLYERADSIVNVAAITGYTNAWIGGRSPEDYINRIRGLGMPEPQLRAILDDHLVKLEHLDGSRWDDFYSYRLTALTEAVADVLTG